SRSEAALDVADAGEVLVQLALIGDAQLVPQGAGIFLYEVEDGLLVQVAMIAARAAGAEEAIEDGAGVDFLVVGGGLAAPGEVVGVSAAVAGVTRAGIAATLTTDLQRGEASVLADLLGGHLIDGDANLDIGPGRLARLATGQEGGHCPGMVAGAVAIGKR